VTNPARLTIEFAGDEGAQRIEQATDFAAFWRDRFGTVHYVEVPERDGEGFDWGEWFRRERKPDDPPRAVNRDETGLAE
jgi:hypothetical protein